MKQLLAYAQLVRLPNAFTAMADICLGALAVGALREQRLAFACLLLASVALYSAGMVWNDFFDARQDARERPFRPIPSGRVSPRAAALLGAVLLLVGVALAALADVTAQADRWRSLSLSGWLVAAILLYDGWLKRTPLGPVAMGSCRFLNVLLGLSAAGMPIPPWGYLLALVVGTYIAGVTWFARTEAQTSNVNMLIAAALVMLTGLVFAMGVPALAQSQAGDFKTSPLFPYLVAAFAAYLGVALVRAINRPLPQLVQAAVKRAVLGLVLLDAILATALVGVAGLAIAVLLVPARWLGRWVYST
jgi:4-hydroxybenzoate polyprenyltransferase